jgi:hypothetical protein
MEAESLNVKEQEVNHARFEGMVRGFVVATPIGLLLVDRGGIPPAHAVDSARTVVEKLNDWTVDYVGEQVVQRLPERVKEMFRRRVEAN